MSSRNLLSLSGVSLLSQSSATMWNIVPHEVMFLVLRTWRFQRHGLSCQEEEQQRGGARPLPEIAEASEPTEAAHSSYTSNPQRFYNDSITAATEQKQLLVLLGHSAEISPTLWWLGIRLCSEAGAK
eukprot:5526437-Amphidinium_carterae.1